MAVHTSEADMQPSPNNAVALDPENPLLARAQGALKKQLEDTRLRLEGELREKNKLLSDAQKDKEDLGVCLFNFQQQLAQLQMELEKAHETHSAMAAMKEQITHRVSNLKSLHANEAEQVKGERVRSERFQEELDRCGYQGGSLPKCSTKST